MTTRLERVRGRVERCAPGLAALRGAAEPLTADESVMDDRAWLLARLDALARLLRMWEYDHVGPEFSKEVREELLKMESETT